MAPPGVNTFYYYAFTAVDPCLSLIGLYMNYFAPSAFLDPAFPRSSPYAKLTPSHVYLQQQFGGAFAMFAFLMIFMLPYTNDLYVWKMWEAGPLFTDFAALFSMFKAVEAQGRVWRGEAVGNVAILGVIALVRILFVASVGVGKGAGVKKKAS